jgi:hypothetical protein
MRQILCLWLLALAGCAAPLGWTEILSQAESNQTARMTLSGGKIASIASPVDYYSLPTQAKTASEAIQPGGKVTFCALERGSRGQGYRVEKNYQKPFAHKRSLLVKADGEVLERSHTLPLSRVPQHVLASALTVGQSIQTAEIVSGPISEEYWHLVVHDRRGRVFLAKIDLQGNLLATARRNQTRVDS